MLPVTSESLNIQADGIRHRLITLLENVPDHSSEMLKRWKEEFTLQLVSPFDRWQMLLMALVSNHPTSCCGIAPMHNSGSRYQASF
jgi:hypothetical protein